MNSNFLQDLFGERGIRKAILAVFVFLALFLIVQTIGTVKNFGRSTMPATDIITVNGEGQATLAPDVARISFSVENTALTVADAQKKTTEQSNKALEFVKGQGVADADVKTLSYNISPQYSYPNPCAPGMLCPTYPGSPKITGYQVSQTVQVTIRDLTKVGEMLAGLGKQGVQNVSGPAFALDDATAGYTAARADAIIKARAQAKELAKQLGVRLGKITGYYESSGQPYPMAYGMGGDGEFKAAGTPNVPAGENTYTATVSITYEIR